MFVVPKTPHKMLCGVCWRMLRGQVGRRWRGTYDLLFEHHGTTASLRESAATSCGICRVLQDDLLLRLDPTSETLNDELTVTTVASLSMLNNVEGTYRLDFTIHCQYHGTLQLPVKHLKTFVLRETRLAVPEFRTPVSSNTSSDEVLGMALRWISRCQCANTSSPTWYPKRLISLSYFRCPEYQHLKRNGETLTVLDRAKLAVLDTSDWLNNEAYPGTHDRYVTLSHCWGKAKQPLVLTKSEEERFSKGILMIDLPWTFRDAVELASRLPRVGYIWIDSLCILQDPDDLSDWLSQSADMHRVYSESFLNISATAGEHSNTGLFRYREPVTLWEEEVNLNVEGLPGITPTAAGRIGQQQEHPVTPSGWFSWLRWPSWPLLRSAKPASTGPKSDKNLPTRIKESDDIRRCTLINVSSWDTLVNQAPVNKRGWVFQERLLAPRVLHFCQDRIAWECSEFDAAEGQPSHVPKFQLDAGSRVTMIANRTKTQDPDKDGYKIRVNRLGYGTPDPDPHLVSKGIYAFELWADIVQAYSKLALTNAEDRLVALAGIARWMAPHLCKSGDVRYITGLWDRFLESQLLWRVEPVFRRHDHTFEHPSKRSNIYHAPSFSWASVDAQSGTGIIYGEVTDQDILIEVEEASVTPAIESNPFGQVAQAHITVWGKLRKIKIFEKTRGRFGWRLDGRSIDMDQEEHTNVYLDCPAADGPDIFDSEWTYCLPAAKGERTANTESKYLICLLLLKVGEPNVFRRIGLTKLSLWADKVTRSEILEVYPSDVSMPHDGWDELGRHRIRII